MIFINKPVPLMAVFVLQGHIINKHVYFRSINGLKALVYCHGSHGDPGTRRRG